MLLALLTPMQRKLIHQGSAKHGSYTITVPVSWVRKYGLKQGDELDMAEHGNALWLLSGKEATRAQRADVDMRDFHVKQLRNRLQQLYRQGVEHITINYKDGVRTHTRTGRKSRLRDEIEFTVATQMPGMEIEKLSSDTAIIRQFNEPLVENFDASFGKLWNILPNQIRMLIDMRDTLDPKILDEIRLGDKTLNKFCNFCMRVLNKRGESSHARLLSYASAISLIEMFGDLLYITAIEHHKFKKKINPVIVKLLGDLAKAVNACAAYFHDHKQEHIDTLMQLREALYALRNPERLDFANSRTLARLEVCFDMLLNITDEAIVEEVSQ
jgi:phosphate uptake regulator